MTVNRGIALIFKQKDFLMEHPEEKKSEKPQIKLPLTATEMSELLDGQEFTWQIKKEDGDKILIHVFLDKYGSYLEEQ
tara:strand:+ start:25336 stop:25569 length:234 start_codon:yes stop_codon:yes gene_type:complete